MYFRLCPHCSHTFKLKEQTTLSECPRCLSHVGYKKSRSDILLALIFTCFVLYFPANLFPIIKINLMGSIIPMTITQGAVTLFQIDFQLISLIIIASCAIAPFLYLSALLLMFTALKIRSYPLFKTCMTVIHYTKHWVMLDVFLLSLGIAIFKLRAYAEIYLDAGLYPFIALQMVISYLVLRFSEEEFWDKWQSPREHQGDHLIRCTHCANTVSTDDKLVHCDRCHHLLHDYWPNSITNTWAFLICAVLFVLPANLYPITNIISMGQSYTDTIMSGVLGLLTHEMKIIAILIFTASIFIPLFKIISLFWILISIQLKRPVSHRYHMKLFNFVQFIGKWSVMDLLVISILTALLDRGQILDFSPGFGAIAFAFVVLFTMFATESFDKRLIWLDTKFTHTVNH